MPVAAMSRESQSVAGFRWLLFGGVSAFVVAIIVIAGLLLLQHYRQVEQRIASTTQNLSRSVTQTFDGVIETIDVALASSVIDIEHRIANSEIDTAAIDAGLTARQRAVSLVSVMRATDEKGNIIYGQNTPVPHVSVANRESFRQLHAGTARGLFIDRPVLNHITNKWVWTFARRINRPDGTFAGIVYALIESDAIREVLATIRVDKGSSISLRDGDLNMIARYPESGDASFPIGEKRASSSFLRALADDPVVGTYRSGRTSVDGIDRVYSYFRSPKHGFIVNVGLDIETAFAEWRHQAWTTGGVVLLFSLALLGFSAAIARARQRQLQVTESLRHAQEIAGLGSYAYDLRTGCWQSSDIFDRIFGLPADFPRDAEHWVALAAPEDQESRRAYTATVIEQDIPFHREYRIQRKNDGELRWVLSQGKVVRDGNGRPIQIVGTVQDISERKRTEEELRIAAVAFDSEEAMIISDKRQRILKVNRAFTECSGYTAEEIVGKRPNILRSGRHDRAFFQAMWSQINRNGSWQGEIWDRRKNGEEYQKWLTISAVRDEHGNVTHYVGSQHDISERKKAEERIRELAFFDQLTGLPNRTLLMDRLKQAMTVSARTREFCALLLIDLDHFKNLNDTLGHDMGDQLLKQVAVRLSGALRGGDTAARIGGDEFLVLLTGLGESGHSSANQVELVGGKLVRVLSQEYQLDTVPYRITPSIGACLFVGRQTEVDALMKQADMAMYRAKSDGRNGLRFFDQGMEDQVLKHAELEKDLRVAIQERQFTLYYQPQISKNRLVGAEILIRWNHPTRGMVSPAEFIPFAEETGLILSLGAWVLETACRQLANWAKDPAKELLTLSVNVSALQFHQEGFVDQVLSTLAITGARPSRLMLELTESMLVANVETLIVKMKALKAKGVGFALDDFGTGYSSLYYLKRLPLDQLKIDQSFVRGVQENASDASIVTAIITLAASLGLDVIAEGVETEGHRDSLAMAGCQSYQGYFFSRPLPLAGFNAFAEQGAWQQKTDNSLTMSSISPIFL